MYCDLCGEDNLKEYLQADIRPYDIFCSHACIEQHKQDIASGEWSNHDNGLENYYAEDIKNNWKNILITKENEGLADKYQAITSDNADYFVQGEKDE